MLYVLDEPSIGLHQRDNERLLGTLRRLRDLGNTVLVVEHDEDAIRAADYLVDIGPGGRRCTAGRSSPTARPSEVAANPDSVTGAYLSGRRSIPVPASGATPPTASGSSAWSAPRGNNLKNVTASLPTRHLRLRHRRLGRRQVHAGRSRHSTRPPPAA